MWFDVGCRRLFSLPPHPPITLLRTVDYPDPSAWDFDVAVVIVDYSLCPLLQSKCSVEIVMREGGRECEGGREERERERLPFISTLIFSPL